VRQSEADLIEKENEKLKERDWQREKEQREIIRKSETEISAVKKDYDERCKKLELQEEKCHLLKQELDIKIKDQDAIIINGVKRMFNEYKTALEKKHIKQIKRSDAKYKAMIAAIQSELWITVIYATILTVFMAARSRCFTDNLTSFFTGIAIAVKALITNAYTSGIWCAKVTDGIGMYAVQQILYYLIIIIIIIVICGIPGLIIYLIGKKYVEWYKKEIADHISMWVAVVTLAITIFFAEEITSILSINLIWLNIIIHLLYSAGRAYVRGCKKNRGYY
jgi:hypothetical protein